MARNSQYKYMNEESIGPGLLCIICRRPFEDPQSTPCNHIFCRECITRWMRANGELCPACYKFVSTDNLSQISLPLNNMLGTLRVKCTLCGQTDILRKNFDNHISHSCLNARVLCLSPDIRYPYIGPQNQFNNHLPTCSFQPFLSMYNELYYENRQLKEQVQEQLNQIKVFQTESRRQKTEIERVDQRCNQQQIQLNELRDRIADEKINSIDQRCNQQQMQLNELRDRIADEKINSVDQRCNQQQIQLNELRDRIADITDGLSTKKFLTKQPLSSEEKNYYDECKEYYQLTKQPLISVSDEVFDDIIELQSPSIKFGIDEDCNKFDLRDFLIKFCKKLKLEIDDIVVKKIQAGSVMLEAEIYDKCESKDKKIGLKMICQKLTDKLKKQLAKMKIFFMFMGPIKSLFEVQKHRAEIKLNPKHNRKYTQGHSYWLGALDDGKDRGDKPYYCPIGWQRQSFYVTENFYKKFKGWCICYHGTKFSYGLSILLSGLKPADIVAHGRGIYTTPSINYACHPRYAEVKEIPLASQKKIFKAGKYVQFVLECRVRPSDIIRIAPETLSARSTTIDPNINNEIIEWIINNHGKTIVDFNDPASSIICTGILTRVTDKHPGLLPESQWWYKSHLCNRSTCCILGVDLEDLKNQNGDKCNIIFD